MLLETAIPILLLWMFELSNNMLLVLVVYIPYHVLWYTSIPLKVMFVQVFTIIPCDTVFCPSNAILSMMIFCPFCISIGYPLALMTTSPIQMIAEQLPMMSGLVSVWVPEFTTYIVLSDRVVHDKEEIYCIGFVGIQLLFHILVYAVDQGVPSPKSAYLMFHWLGL